MRNKNGFTLIELLVVVAILAILMLISIPNIQNAFSKANNTISSVEKKNLEDAAERAVLEVIYCDVSESTIKGLGRSGELSCEDMKTIVVGNTIITSVDNLRENKYFQDLSERCSGNVSITTDSNYKVSVDTSDVKCG